MIKKILGTALIVVLACSVSYAQKPVQVKGDIDIPFSKTVKLFKVVNGKTVEIANAGVSKTKKFGFLFYPEYEGLYVIGTGNENAPNDNIKFYFKPGDQLEVSITDTAYALKGNLNSKENLILKQWDELVQPLHMKAINFMKTFSTFMDYFPQQELIVARAKTFAKGKTSGNPKFDKELKNIMELDLINYATNFLNTPRSAHPGTEELSSFYTTIKAASISKSTKKIYNYPWGLRVLSATAYLNMRQDNKTYKSAAQALALSLPYITNDTLKGDLVLENLATYKNYADYKSITDLHGKYLLTKAQKEKDNALITPILTYKVGTDGLQFAYPDKEGNQISFASLKGKVVLVDVWATWCGPCKSEFPHLKQLEKDIEGKPIQIVSISTDSEKDKAKWLQMIKDENLGGMQLYAGQDNEFSKYYKVNTIPRFLVFDKNGKIVNIDAPRPSEAKLKELLFAEAAK